MSEPVTLTKGTLVPIGLAGALLVAAFAAGGTFRQLTGAIEDQQGQVAQVSQQLTELRREVGEINAKSWTVRDHRAWIAAAERMGVRLPSVEMARSLMTFPGAGSNQWWRVTSPKSNTSQDPKP